jgi:hypothetical protein
MTTPTADKVTEPIAQETAMTVPGLLGESKGKVQSHTPYMVKKSNETEL